MSEAELRECLRDAVLDEPPLDFDPDALIERGEHLRKRRRALVAVGVATLALTASVLTLPGALGGRRPVDAAVAPVITTTDPPASSHAPQSPVTPPAVPSGSATGSAAEGSAEGSAERIKRLEARLRKAFIAAFPQVKVLQVTIDDTAVSGGPLTSVLLGSVVFLDDRGPAELNVTLTEADSAPTTNGFCANVVCERRLILADGSTVFLGTVADKADGHLAITAAHFRQDGVVVQVSAHHSDPAPGAVVGGRSGAPATYDQLMLLATDQALSIR